MRDIGKNIRDLRERKGLTQEELASLLFVTRQTVSNYENGRSRPDVDMIIRIGEVLEADVNTVFYGPPKKESRQKEIMIAAVMFAIAVLLLAVTPKVFYQARLYTGVNFEPHAMLLYYTSWYPAVMFYAGWSGMKLMGALLPIKLPNEKWVKILKYVLRSIAAIYFAILLPWAVYCICELCGWNIGNGYYPKIYDNFFVNSIYSNVITWPMMEANKEYPVIIAAFGAMVSLFSLKAGEH